MPESPIGVGIVGANPHRGWASSAHIPALRARPEYEIRAASTTSDVADDVKHAYGIDHVFDNNAEMIRRPEVELVVVAVKVPWHRELITAALNAGKAVYSEWPLGIDLAEATGLADHARRAGAHTMIGLQNRVAPGISHVRDAVSRGDIGDVRSTTMTVSAMGGDRIDQANAYMFDIRNGANMLTIALGQGVDALTQSLGEWQELTALLATRTPSLTVIETGARIPRTSHDQAAVIGTLTSGATASVHFRGSLSYEDSFRWEINGSGGDLLVTAAGSSPGIFPLTVHRRAKGAAEFDTLPVSPLEHPGMPAGSPASNVAEMYSRLAADLREGTWTVPDFNDAVVRHRMLAAIEESARTGTRQTYLPDTGREGDPT
jgi:predicted dehydrogenase